MELPKEYTEDYLLSLKVDAYNELLKIFGHPDQYCIDNSNVALIWYFEGYKNPEYYDKDYFVGKYCGESLQLSNSSMVLIFDCNGNYINSTMIKKGG